MLDMEMKVNLYTRQRHVLAFWYEVVRVFLKIMHDPMVPPIHFELPPPFLWCQRKSPSFVDLLLSICKKLFTVLIPELKMIIFLPKFCCWPPWFQLRFLVIVYNLSWAVRSLLYNIIRTLIAYVSPTNSIKFMFRTYVIAPLMVSIFRPKCLS